MLKRAAVLATASVLALISATAAHAADMPGDPGGATNMGITRATLAAWRGHAVSKDEVLSLERDEAEDGAAIGLGQLPPAV